MGAQISAEHNFLSPVRTGESWCQPHRAKAEIHDRVQHLPAIETLVEADSHPDGFQRISSS